jgi:hypothetical protein
MEHGKWDAANEAKKKRKKTQTKRKKKMLIDKLCCWVK